MLKNKRTQGGMQNRLSSPNVVIGDMVFPAGRSGSPLRACPGRITAGAGTTYRALLQRAVLHLVFVCVMLLSFPSSGVSGERPETVEDLRASVETLQQAVDRLEEEIKGLRHMLKDFEDDELYLVVDTESNQLTMRQGTAVLHKALCGTGSRVFIEGETGRNWYFETPMGSFTVLGKERNPVWIRPDWSYVEENMPIPPADDPDRFVRDVLGKYAILLGNGYKIHGTKWTHLLGTHFTHGCVSLGDDDLELVYKSVRIGTKVYLY